MKQLASTYSISGSSVTLTGVNVPLSQILLVSDATTGNVLYSMAGPAATSYTQAANSVITLASAPGSSDKLTIYYDDGATVTNGPTSVSIANFPTAQSVTGAFYPAVQPVQIVGDTLSSMPVSLTAAASIASGQSVGVSSLPAVTGNVGITSLPSISGTVTVSNPTTATPTLGAAVSLASGQSVGVSSLPAVTGNVGITSLPSISGTVTVSNPQTSVSIANFPTAQSVTGAFYPAVQPVQIVGDTLSSIPVSLTAAASIASGQSVGVSSLPAVTGNVGITSLPSISGSVTVSNFPSVQSVSGTVTANVTFPTTQNVSLVGSSDATAIPVSGTVTASNSNLDVALSSRLKPADTLAGVTAIGSITNPVTIQGGNSTAVKVDGSAVTQPVSLASVPSHAVTNAGTFAVQPSAGDLTSGSQTTKIVNGSATLAIDSTGAVTQNNQALSSVQTFTQPSGSITAGQVLIGPITCSQYRDVCIHVVTNGASAQLQPQVSNDGNNWGIASMSTANGVYSAQTASPGVNIWQTPTCGAVYWRLVATGAVSGSLTVNASFSQQVQARAVQQVNASAISLGTSGSTIGAVLPPTVATVNQTTGTAATGTATAVTLTGGTASKLLVIQNTAASGVLYIGLGAASTTASFALTAGQGYEFPVIPTQSIYLLGSTASVTYSILSA